MAIRLEDYANKYKTIKFERRDGILQMTLHSQGKELKWGECPTRSAVGRLPTSAATPKTRRRSDLHRRGLLR